jgi:YaiO family outer membrane protein
MLAILAAALIAAPLPAAAQVPAQASADPYSEAVSARRAGDPARAAALLRQLIVSEPENADAHLQLGYSLLALGRLDEAEASFRQTLALAPDYADARIGLARVAQRRGDRQGALALLEPVDPANREAGELRDALGRGGGSDAPLPSRARVDLDVSYSFLDGPAPDWREASLQANVPLGERSAATALVEVSERFDRTDVYGELRLDRRIGANAGFYFSLGATPDADFRPEWQIGGGGFARLRGGRNATVLTLDARQARYASGDIQTLNPGVEQYIGGRFWLTGRWINIFDEDGDHQAGWLLRGDWLATDRLRLFAGAADAPDTSEGLVIDTFSLFGGLSYDVTDRIIARLSVAQEDRETGSDRLQVGLGVGTRF